MFLYVGCIMLTQREAMGARTLEKTVTASVVAAHLDMYTNPSRLALCVHDTI